MLGKAVKIIVTVRPEWLGALCDLLEKLNGKKAEEWYVRLKRILRKEESQGNFEALQTIHPFSFDQTEERIIGTDFVARAMWHASDSGFEDLGDNAYNFYKKPENHHLMPTDPTVKVVVFTRALFFHSAHPWGGSTGRAVRCLEKNGEVWVEGIRYISDWFGRECYSAVK